MSVIAAKEGNMDILKWLKENGYNWEPGTCAAAAREGHLEALKWLRENGCEWDRNSMNAVAQKVIWKC